MPLCGVLDSVVNIDSMPVCSWHAEEDPSIEHPRHTLHDTGLLLADTSTESDPHAEPRHIYKPISVTKSRVSPPVELAVVVEQ